MFQYGLRRCRVSLSNGSGGDCGKGGRENGVFFVAGSTEGRLRFDRWERGSTTTDGHETNRARSRQREEVNML